MDFSDKDIKRLSIIVLIVALGVLVFMVLKPVALAIVGGLILAYIFYPIYKFLLKFIKEKNTVAVLVSLFVIILILIPLWFITPIMIKQVFQIFTAAQTLDVSGFVKTIFPTATDEFTIQVTSAVSGAIGKTSTAILNSLADQFRNLPNIVLHFILIAFVFFFTLRDWETLKEFVSGISPLNKSQEIVLVKHFRDITDSIIYGHVIAGLLQGILAGIGFLLFSIPNALVLTVLAVVLGILPILGPPIIWIPLTVYLFTTGKTGLALGFLIYNLIVVTGVESFLKLYIVSKRSNLPTIIVLVGMISGVLIFGVIGFILGPLVLAYFLVLLKAYKEKALASLFAE